MLCYVMLCYVMLFFTLYYPIKFMPTLLIILVFLDMLMTSVVPFFFIRSTPTPTLRLKTFGDSDSDSKKKKKILESPLQRLLIKNKKMEQI